ncbi:MAG: hypothetical protein K6B70_03935 [Clostridia bacterium]|nr:hypothetical protein [Clostridia bacterium]
MLKGFLQKIKAFFARIFNKNKLMLQEADTQEITEEQTINVENTAQENTAEKKHNTIQILKNENKKNQTVNEIIEIVEANPELMVNLTDEQLDVIDEYYINANKKLKQEIEIMNNKIADIKSTIKKMDNQIAGTNANN